MLISSTTTKSTNANDDICHAHSSVERRSVPNRWPSINKEPAKRGRSDAVCPVAAWRCSHVIEINMRKRNVESDR